MNASATYGEVFDVHFLIPKPRKFEKVLAMRVLDEAADCVVSAAEIASRLEFKIGHHSSLWAANVGMISKLVFHGTEEDPSCVHVRLSDEAERR
jgi:hypothetical protein